ncbi:N-6 DNA methylase [Actinoplanes sp. DH11]|uniref:N-6 DNA methylase n=1 Tax=Actinoplanes sp. DH11 TaxID=2857011 RepID=UPI001E4BD162|nr:N-6 DNA methylase [Actinoplanes sp. DH11]
MQQKARVTAADIARLAGVGRAAVTNWRKRYNTFPAPVGGTAASPQFDLDEVEHWLAQQGKLPSVTEEDRLWRSLLATAGDPSEALALAGEHLLGNRRLPFEALRGDLDVLAERHGVRAALEQLWTRFADLPGQRSASTPDALADLMASLGRVSGGVVLDPACGTGRILRAVARAGAAAVYGQDNDSAATRLASLWIDANGLTGEIRTGDSLRHDAYPDLSVDAVVTNLPFGLANWGQDELGYDDRRWVYGLPPRTEPELAWVQHAIAHLKPGGTAVLLMPPSAAGRRAGRRIRGDLLRGGAIRAIIALPQGAAAPHAVGLHLWVLQRTGKSVQDVLIVNAGELELEAAYRQTKEAYSRFLAGQDPAGGIAAAVPAIDLLDEDIDLTPGRHLQGRMVSADSADDLRETRERLAHIVNSLPSLLPSLRSEVPAAVDHPMISLGELARTGALEILGPVRGGAESGAAGRILTAQDVFLGRPATVVTSAEDRVNQEIPLRAGDVVLPMISRELLARVQTEDGVLLGRQLCLLRPVPDQLNPWFLAGHLRTSANERLASSLSGSMRLDVRRAQVPRIPIAEQMAHGEIFRQLTELNDAVRQAAALGADMTRLTADGLASGRLRPVAEEK